ncbi:MAG: TIGR01777 family protein [Acidobacteria bacterium]|nr:TIGR01777 family protein [Acidobacteriota bacterium]
MKVTITGASGLVGRRLIQLLLEEGHSLHALSRGGAAGFPEGVRVARWDPLSAEPPAGSLEGAQAVVHLAGEPVAQRWTAEVKRKIRDSRVQGTRRLVEGLSTLSPRPAALVSASAVGFYGSRGDELLTEASAPGSGFLAETCQEWERQAELAESLGIRVAKIRIGVVLAPHGGALKRMLPAFRAFAGGRLASGRQWMSWIHLDDLAALIRHAITAPVMGPVNATAPNPVTNAGFTRALAAALGRPAIFPVPGFVVRTVFGEMSEVLLSSQRALPKAAEASGFRFRYPEAGMALRQMLQ